MPNKRYLDEDGLQILWDGGETANHNGGIKAKIEAAKSAAISTASSDATSKVNTAKTALETRIGTEETNRASEITRVEGLITDEATARGSADTALGGRIDGVVSRVSTVEGFFKALTGENAGIAKKAEKDASGNIITSTYATKDELSTLSSTVTTIGGYFSNGTATKAIGDKNGDDITTTYIKVSQKGVANGVATLDANGTVPAAQLPSFVDDVVEGYLKTADGKFYGTRSGSAGAYTYTNEIVGVAGKIYTDLETNITYRWSGTQFTEISKSLALGETSSTAYAGNKGAANAAAIATLQGQVATINTTYIPKLVELGNANSDGITWHKTDTSGGNIITWGIKTTGTTGVSKQNAGFYLTTDVSKASNNSTIKLFTENDNVEIGGGYVKLVATNVTVTGTNFKFNNYNVITDNDYITEATINSILA